MDDLTRVLISREIRQEGGQEQKASSNHYSQVLGKPPKPPKATTLKYKAPK